RPTGGHASATRELWFRWCSLGAFSPIMATHQGPAAAGGWRFDHTDETRQHYARYAKEHLALFPYLRGLADVAAAEGTPLLLPPAMQYGGPWDRTDAWLLGDALLVAPVQQEGAVGRDVDLPPDVDWYDYWTGTPVQSGWFEADETAIPVFVAAGTVLPVLTEVPQTLVSDAGSHLTTLQDVDRLRTIRVFGSGGRFEEADGTRYVVRGTPVRQDEVTITMTSGSVDVGGAAVSIRGFRERTYVLEVNP
ncbi:MAG: TIM-barrel domain-containing protein, partial [Myxococcota bacterium]|nr:TIM-barrel domain-containing protein [Myxococcota bacterium]